MRKGDVVLCCHQNTCLFFTPPPPPLVCVCVSVYILPYDRNIKIIIECNVCACVFLVCRKIQLNFEQTEDTMPLACCCCCCFFIIRYAILPKSIPSNEYLFQFLNFHKRSRRSQTSALHVQTHTNTQIRRCKAFIYVCSRKMKKTKSAIACVRAASVWCSND